MGSQDSQGRSADAAGALVLIVDDDPAVLRVLHRILAAAGHRVLALQSQKQMSRFLFDPDLAVILLDLFMDGANGVDVLESIKRQRPDVEVVVVTGHGSVDSAVRCIRRGAFEYLEKPFRDLGRIRMAVSAALARHAETLRAEARKPALCVDERTSVAGLAEESRVPLSLEAYERLALERALQESDGDASLAASRLGIGRSTFYRKAAKHGVALRGLTDESEGPMSGGGVGRGPSIG
jgi:DNA-binding NtrC family response regulator